jgi:hypothetical protein
VRKRGFTSVEAQVAAEEGNRGEAAADMEEGFEIVDNVAPSSDDNFPSRHRRSFNDDIADAVNAADEKDAAEDQENICDMADELADEELDGQESAVYKSLQMPSHGLDNDLESLSIGPHESLQFGQSINNDNLTSTQRDASQSPA